MQVTSIGSIVSIAFFNFFGLSVTKSLSGAARATIDATRTLLIWLFSIQIGWERFHFLQVQSPLHSTVLLHAMPAAGIMAFCSCECCSPSPPLLPTGPGVPGAAVGHLAVQ